MEYILGDLFSLDSVAQMIREITERFAPLGVRVNATHPGMVNADFGKGASKGFWTDLVYRSAPQEILSCYTTLIQRSRSMR